MTRKLHESGLKETKHISQLAVIIFVAPEKVMPVHF